MLMTVLKGELVDISSNTLSNMGKGEYVSMENLVKICRAINLPHVTYLDLWRISV